jgi:hypothetical protein
MEMERLKFSLSPATRSQLDAVAAASGKSIGDEIRERLQHTFKEDALDPALRELRDAIANLAELVRIDCGDWHSSPRAHTEFVTALMQRLAGYTPPAPVAAASDPLLPDPEMLGRIREQDDRRQHSYPQLEAAQKRKTAVLGMEARQQRKPGKPARVAQHIKQDGGDE